MARWNASVTRRAKYRYSEVAELGTEEVLSKKHEDHAYSNAKTKAEGVYYFPTWKTQTSTQEQNKGTLLAK
jgi:hypothetical protein